MLQSKNKDHLSPVEAGAGTELGKKDKALVLEQVFVFVFELRS